MVNVRQTILQLVGLGHIRGEDLEEALVIAKAAGISILVLLRPEC